MSTASRQLKKRIASVALLAGLASIAAWAAVSMGVFSSASTADVSSNHANASNSANPPGAKGARVFNQDGARPHLVIFREAPLASYRGSGATAVPRVSRGGRVDVKSAQARNYVKYLKTRQQDHVNRLGQALGRPLHVAHRMQHAVNGFVTVLSPDEAAAVRQQSDVALVEEYREYEADTDVGPRLIGAEAVWNGVGGTTAQAAGEGMVVAVFDSGINFGSPSFAATGADGYTVVNPNGPGNYIGTCAAGGPDEGRCNDKLIGGYDFVCDYKDINGVSLVKSCGLAGIREEPGFGDTNSHGSHTASTAAGNVRDVVFRGVPLRISGVAPHANIIAFDICYTTILTGSCSAPNISVVASVDQVIADGLADAINYSFSGGASPWSESVSLALLNAVDAGVYVAASAGNSGPGPGTLGHTEPWVASTAAAQHGRAGFEFFLSLTGPAPVPAPLESVLLQAGSGGVDLAASIPGGTSVKLIAGTAPNAGIDGPSDGCAAYPAGTFAGAIAVIRRGTCGFAIKAANARDAGAIALVIANNQPGLITPSVSGPPAATIPVFMVTQVDADAIRDFVVVNPSATAAIPFPAFTLANTVDALGGFSSRGPAAFDVLKPDLTAPGVAILAAIAGTTLTGFENAIALFNGTSMASPHQAGAATLLRQLHPSWTVPEIKSALMLTASQSVLLEDQTTPADAFGAGAGRVQVDLAARAGLVMHETKANYVAADPGIGGDPSKLNQPSMAKSRCVRFCTFTRIVRNTLPHKQLWTAHVDGVLGVASPAAFLLKPGESKAIKVTVFTFGQPADGSWRFGELKLTPTALGNRHQPKLHMPIAVSIPVPPLPLQNGVPVTDLAGAAGSSLLYALEVPAGATSLTFTTQGGTGDVDLYVKQGSEPSSSVFDCASESGTNDEICTFNAPAAGTWYVRLVAFKDYAGVTLTGTYP